jgi:hypothetical protein
LDNQQCPRETTVFPSLLHLNPQTPVYPPLRVKGKKFTSQRVREALMIIFIRDPGVPKYEE